MTLDQENQLAALVRQRRSQVPSGYMCVSEFHNGKYDCDFVSPWTKSAHNTSFRLMVIAQDWASQKYLERPYNWALAECGYDEGLKTNKCLSRLLRQYLNLGFNETYATNVFPFIKQGDMQGHIPRCDLIKAAKEYALPQIKIVDPLMVICLGIGTLTPFGPPF
jgi:hypothetical protein